jgi:subtilase family serine protease
MCFQRCVRLLPVVAILIVTTSSRLQAEPPSRIHGEVDSGNGFTLQGNVRARPRVAVDGGDVASDQPLSRVAVHFQMSAAQQKALTQLLADQQNRSSRNYHRWLTPEQFADRFGLSNSDLKKVTTWLERAGFTDVQVARGRTYVTMSGSASLAQGAFGTAIHRFEVNGEQHFGSVNDPVLPKALQGIVGSIDGLNDFRPKPHVKRLRPHFTSSISGSHFLAPDDFATIYNLHPLYNSGLDGTGQKIAVAGQTDISLPDIEAFRAASGLPVNDPQVVLTGPDPGVVTDDRSEAHLDLEWSGAVAPGATVIYVNSKNALTSLEYAIDNNLAPVISISYGLCESQTGAAAARNEDTVLQQANAQGQTIVAASGDSGAADCDGGSPTPDGTDDTSVATQGLNVDYPASSVYVTGMGGTTLTEGVNPSTYWSSTNNSKSGSALSYIPEVAWNDTGSGLAASGGGASILFAKPSWQVGTNVPADNKRDVPDLSLASSPSHDGYLVCDGGDCVNGFRNTDSTVDLVGGTSVAAPTFAGVVVLLNQKRGASQGNVNPGLYQLASISTDAFHDVTSGSNQVPCKQGSTDCPVVTGTATATIGYTAIAGYDLVTGLGSIDATNLLNEWGASFTITTNPSTFTLAAGGTASPTITVAAVDGFSGSVTFACSVSSTLTNTTCTPPGPLTGSGTATLTIANSSRAGIVVPPSPFSNPWLPGSALAAFVFLAWSGRRRRLALIGAFAGCLLLMTSCGDNGSSSNTTTETVTPPETGTVTVTATSGVLTQTAVMNVTVP